MILIMIISYKRICVTLAVYFSAKREREGHKKAYILSGHKYKFDTFMAFIKIKKAV